MMPRRAFRVQFTLRTLLCAVFVGGILMAPIGSRIRRAERQRFIIGQVYQAGGTIYFADEHSVEGYAVKPAARIKSNWFREFLGDGYFRSIDCVDVSTAQQVSPELFGAIAALPSLLGLSVSPRVADDPGVLQVRQAHPRMEFSVRWNMIDTFGNVVATADEFKTTIARPRVVLFVDGDGSFNAVAARPILSRHARSLDASGALPKVFLSTLDLSDPDAQTRLFPETQAWMDSQSLPRGSMKAYGRVGMAIWIENERLISYRWNPHTLNKTEFLRITREAFGGNEPTGQPERVE